MSIKGLLNAVERTMGLGRQTTGQGLLISAG
jgi:hypothetical protein